jgi:hypothetical protein
MANTDGAFGFRPISRDGSPYNGATLRCVFAAADATAAFIGDPVILDGSSSEGYPGVSQCAAAEPVFGVVTAFEANPDSLGDQYLKASTKRFCQVTPANGTYFEVQEDGDGTDLLAVEVGLNAGFEVAAGSTTYGISGFELDASDASTTSTLDLQIVALVDRADNQLTGTGNANKSVIVKFNDPQDKPLRTGV